MRLFDTHTHLQDERLAVDAAGVFERAQRAGVERMVCCGTSEADWPAVARLAVEHPTVIPFFGLHPFYLRDMSARWLDSLHALLAATPFAGVGEIGLDRTCGHPDDLPEQESVFMAQLEMARGLGRPVSIHCRGAFGRLAELLEAAGGAPTGAVLHSYSGSAEMASRLEQLGLWLSFSGSVTWSNHRRARSALRRVSAERLLIETDCPDIAVAGVAGRPVEPADLAIVAKAAAGELDLSVEEVAARTWQNASCCLAQLPRLAEARD